MSVPPYFLLIWRSEDKDIELAITITAPDVTKAIEVAKDRVAPALKDMNLVLHSVKPARVQAGDYSL